MRRAGVHPCQICEGPADASVGRQIPVGIVFTIPSTVWTKETESLRQFIQFSAVPTAEFRRPFATNFHQASPMLEILVVMAVIAILMAKKRRKFRRYLKGVIQNRFTLGTLAATTLISSTNADAVTERAWLSTIMATWSMDQFTEGAGDGPILVGIAHSDYTDAQIEEFVEQAESWEEGDLVAKEISSRKIRRVGTFGQTGPALSGMVLNDGRPIRTKCGWILSTGQTIKFWAYNQGSSALATTSPAVVTAGHANLWPR